MKQRFVHIAIAPMFSFLLLATSCVKEKPFVAEQLAITASNATKATLYETEEDLENEANFIVEAYHNGTVKYISDAWAYYRKTEGDWIFRDESNRLHYYWPQTGDLDMMAYLPRDYQTSTKTVSNIRYDEQKLSFDFERTTTIDTPGDPDAGSKEFMVALTKDRTNAQGPVPLIFVHPFAAIKFELTQSHRDLTLKSIRFVNIDTRGTYTIGETTSGQNVVNRGQWTSDKGPYPYTYTITFNKNVPTHMNFSDEIGGPYIVIPQSLEDATMTIVYEWFDTDGVTRKEYTKSDISLGGGTWDPGKLYTYHMNLGDAKEEILFKISVKDWVKGEEGDYENEYDVE